jgi:hypothetical protein
VKTKTWSNEIARENWPAGEWDHEPDRIQWMDEATGLPCLAAQLKRTLHAAAHHEQYQENIRKVKMRMEVMDAGVENRWISVDEMLPDEGVEVLVWLFRSLDGDVFKVCYIDDDGQWRRDTGDKIPTPRHWMPLPEAPK